MIRRNNATFIFDLDLTLLTINSFHQLLIVLAVRPPFEFSFRAYIKLRLVVWAFLRAIKILSRQQFKQKVQGLVRMACQRGENGERFLRDFMYLLVGAVNPGVYGCYRVIREEGCSAVLSTGAMPEYAERFGRDLGFDLVVCTSAVTEGQWTENTRENKRDRTLRVLKEAGRCHDLKVLFADDPDDLSLAAVCDLTFWVGDSLPDKLTLANVDADVVQFTYSGFREWFDEHVAK